MVGSGDLQQLQLAGHCIDQGIGKALQKRDKKEAGKKKQKRSSRCILTTDCAWQWHQCLAHLHVLPAEFCAESALHSACLLPTSPLTSPRNLLMSTRCALSLCTLQFCFAHNVAFLKSLVLPEINSSLAIDLSNESTQQQIWFALAGMNCQPSINHNNNEQYEPPAARWWSLTFCRWLQWTIIWGSAVCT